ncbi:Sodium/hydrogen exchanger family-domain-containing protein [Hysterangium stoloniferum]|nr:Sodium/hydrogen exchanger family-domain-containing protein [Hysterangium stoloniferum]
MVSLLVRQRLYIGESILATAFGIIIGPHCANVINPRTWGTDTNAITLEVMRITLATGLFAIGAELPRAYLAQHWRSLTIMVIPTMAFGWIVCASFMFWFFPGLGFISALCISACLTPTDPILAVAITSGTYAVKHVPVNIRRLIAAESAANDGLAYPFLSISIYLSVEASKRTALGKWFLIGWLYQVVLGIIIGACLGLGFCYIMKFAQKRGFIDRESYVAQYIALSLLSIGLTNMLGSDDLLAAFAAGTAMSWDGHFNLQTENDIFSVVIDLVINSAAFIYIGAWLPFEAYNTPELSISPGRLIALFLCILMFRRLPALLVMYNWVPDINGWREAVFTGHFGVGAVFISTLALSRLDEPHIPPRNQEERLAASLHPIVSFVVLGSIIIHGLSIPFFKLSQQTVTLTSTWSRSYGTGPEWLAVATGSPRIGNTLERTLPLGSGAVTLTTEPTPRQGPATIPPPLDSSAEVEVLPVSKQVSFDTSITELRKDSLPPKSPVIQFCE